jgi:hypothetical protein
MLYPERSETGTWFEELGEGERRAEYSSTSKHLSLTSKSGNPASWSWTYFSGYWLDLYDPFIERL